MAALAKGITQTALANQGTDQRLQSCDQFSTTLSLELTPSALHSFCAFLLPHQSSVTHLEPHLAASQLQRSVGHSRRAQLTSNLHQHLQAVPQRGDVRLRELLTPGQWAAVVHCLGLGVRQLQAMAKYRGIHKHVNDQQRLLW